MRFFRSLSLLHRRSKSDTVLTSPPHTADDPVILISASPRLVDPHLNRPFTSLNQRVFEVGLDNERLTRVNASLALKLALVETQLQLTMSELYAEMHKNVHLLRQAQQDQGAISDLQKASQCFQRFLDAFPDVDLTFKSFHPSASANANKDTSMSTMDGVSSTGRQSEEQQYSTALQIILKTRQDLRSCRKLSLFWKRKAKTVPEHEDLVTPSPSDISEVQDVLPKERIEAVTALQRKRRLMSTSVTQATLASASFSKTPKPLPAIPHSTAADLKEGLVQGNHAQFEEFCREKWDTAGNQGGSEKENVVAEEMQHVHGTLRRKAGSVDLRQSISFGVV